MLRMDKSISNDSKLRRVCQVLREVIKLFYYLK